jgi:hypothetical protein
VIDARGCSHLLYIHTYFPSQMYTEVLTVTICVLP